MMSGLISSPVFRFHPAVPQAATPRVLIAQDDTPARHRLARALRQDGFAIVELSPPARLAAYLTASHRDPSHAGISAVIAELDLSDYTASDLLACLRLRECSMPLILVSSRVDRDLVQQAYRLGAIAILGPAYDLEVMRGIIRNITAA